MLKDKLTKFINSKPEVIQFAKDRKFEESWIIPLSDSKPTGKNIDNYLNIDKFELLIMEYIWNFKDNDNRFVLTLFLDKKCQLQDNKKFINTCLNLKFVTIELLFLSTAKYSTSKIAVIFVPTTNEVIQPTNAPKIINKIIFTAYHLL